MSFLFMCVASKVNDLHAVKYRWMKSIEDVCCAEE
jgi:hypothetical protein